MPIKRLLILLLFVSFNTKAFQDGLLLAEIAATLAKDLKQTLKLLEIAEEQQETLDKVYNNIEDRRLLARRVIRKMEYLQSIQELEIQDLRSFNRALAELKFQYKDAEQMKNKLANSLLLDDIASSRIDIARDSTSDTGSEIRTMWDRSHTGSFEQSSKNTAINTSLISDILNEQRKDNLEFQSRIIEEIQRNKEREFVQQEARIQSEKFYGIDADKQFWESQK